MEKIDWDSWFVYDESSPSFLVWKVNRWSGKYYNQRHVSKGDVAGAFGSSGYFSVKLNNRLHLCHRVIFEMFNKCDCEDFFGSEGWKHRMGWD